MAKRFRSRALEEKRRREEDEFQALRKRFAGKRGEKREFAQWERGRSVRLAVRLGANLKSVRVKSLTPEFVIDLSKPSIPRRVAWEFYCSPEWAEIRRIVLERDGACCVCCGEQEGVMVVDHIKPTRKFWDLRADLANLQVLCPRCNRIKGDWCIVEFKKLRPGRRLWAMLDARLLKTWPGPFIS